MDDFKGKIGEEVLDSLTMEDLWKSPRLKKLVEEKYPRAYLSITEPMREFGLFNFIKLAEAQIKYIKEAPLLPYAMTYQMIATLRLLSMI